MIRLSLVLIIFALVCPNAVADESTSIPAPFVKQLKRMVGSWVFTGHEGDRRFSGEEKIRLVNNNTALLQEGFFNVGGGEKEHYVILSGWDGEKKKMFVRGFTSDGVTWVGEWKKIKDDALVGAASGRPAEFVVSNQTMKYEEDGGKWISKFERTGKGE